MKTFNKEIQFRYPWRSYQKRALDELHHHLQNDKFHLVAPPGSGKTVLGLEVMLQLNKATLIIAPTLAIRNQWIDRFVQLFLQIEAIPDWITTDIKHPKFVTVTTYQALHQVYRNEEGSSEERERLKEFPFQTLILDEAHHLRTAWWESTLSFIGQMKNPSIVSLTATPPYDASIQEWQRYIQLCGPIDAEIYVPELVREGELCAHQDYIYFSAPTTLENEPILAYHSNVTEFIQNILHNEVLKALLKNHPFIQHTEDNMEEILENPNYFFSMMMYLKEVGMEDWQSVLKRVTKTKTELPILNAEWLEEMLTEIIYKDDYFKEHEEIVSIRKHLSRIGAIERRVVTLKTNSAIKKTLTRSVSKLKSFEKIVAFEMDVLKEAARIVILTDFIYKEDLPKTKDDKNSLMRLGVIPIFESLRREKRVDRKLAVLTGSIVIIPKSAICSLEKEADQRGFEYYLTPLEHDEAYVQLTWKTTSNAMMVSVLTAVFESGEINCVIGTAALLGEGWDAPAINALILASYVGSYMLSNQMRGRAIRSELGNQKKTANIWHLVCMDQEELDGGYDYLSLVRRFDSLMGLHTTKPIITTGIKRMEITLPLQTKNAITSQNGETIERASRRQILSERWQGAVKEEGIKKEVLYTDKQKLPRPFVFGNTLKAIIITAIITIVQMPFGTRPQTTEDIRMRILVGILMGMIISSPYIYKAIKGLIRNMSLERHMKEVALVIYETLHAIGHIKTSYDDGIFQVEEGPFGEVHIWLEKGTIKEQRLFTEALQEFMDPIENPRYVLYRRSGRFIKKEDYHSIPEEIGRKKEYVEIFLENWEKHMDKATYIYTRTREGRQHLLTARTRSMSAIFMEKSERISEWR